MTHFLLRPWWSIPHHLPSICLCCISLQPDSGLALQPALCGVTLRGTSRVLLFVRTFCFPPNLFRKMNRSWWKNVWFLFSLGSRKHCVALVEAAGMWSSSSCIPSAAVGKSLGHVLSSSWFMTSLGLGWFWPCVCVTLLCLCLAVLLAIPRSSVLLIHTKSCCK